MLGTEGKMFFRAVILSKIGTLIKLKKNLVNTPNCL